MEERQVLHLAAMTGWRAADFRTSMYARGEYQMAVAGDGAGFPDLVLFRDRVHYRELKSVGGRLRAYQRAWGEALVNAGVDWAVWRPIDWTSKSGRSPVGARDATHLQHRLPDHHGDRVLADPATGRH